MDYNFEWDPAKAILDRSTYGISFEQAATIFHDPHAGLRRVDLVASPSTDQIAAWVAAIGKPRA